VDGSITARMAYEAMNQPAQSTAVRCYSDEIYVDRAARWAIATAQRSFFWRVIKRCAEAAKALVKDRWPDD